MFFYVNYTMVTKRSYIIKKPMSSSLTSVKCYYYSLLSVQSFFFGREESSESRIRVAMDNDRIDSKYGFDRVRDAKERTGYLINMHTVRNFQCNLNKA